MYPTSESERLLKARKTLEQADVTHEVCGYAWGKHAVVELDHTDNCEDECDEQYTFFCPSPSILAHNNTWDEIRQRVQESILLRPFGE